MKFKDVSVDCGTFGSNYEATLEFTTDSQMLVNYVLGNRNERFNIAVRKSPTLDMSKVIELVKGAKRMDGMSAMVYTIDELHAVRNHETKVIFNPPATILFKDGKKYVSKAHDEEYDEEKGLLMCLAKANGISHLELKRMIKNAKRPQEEDLT